VEVERMRLAAVVEGSYLKPFESIVQVAPLLSRVVMRLLVVLEHLVVASMAPLGKLALLEAVAVAAELNCSMVILPQSI